MNRTSRRSVAGTFAVMAVLVGAVLSPATVSADGGRPVIRGEVTRVDAENGVVTIDHEPIAALDMPAMTMDFLVPHPAMLQGIEKGTNVEFQAVDDGGTLMIRALMAMD